MGAGEIAQSAGKVPAAQTWRSDFRAATQKYGGM